MAAVPEAAASEAKAIVLLVDDQLIIVEAIRRMLGAQPDIAFHYCTDAAKALETAERLQPSCILQDLVMPAMDGFELIGPAEGWQACRAVGPGRMVEPEELLKIVTDRLVAKRNR